MSFRIEFVKESVEFRSRSSRNGTDRNGNPRVYRSIRIEDEKGEPVQFSVNDDMIWESCMALKKGDYVNLCCIAMANDQWNMLALTDEPERVPEPDEE